MRKIVPVSFCEFNVVVYCVISSSLFFFSCSKKTCDYPNTSPVFRSSSSSRNINFPYFNSLVSPIDGAVYMNRSPNLNWRAAYDEENDEVFYDIFLDKDGAKTKIDSLLTTEHYTVDNLDPVTTYYWKVEAYDSVNKNQRSSSVVWSFKTQP